MKGDRPLYLMLKPPLEIAMQLELLRRLLGLGEDYGRDRFHVTLLPLCDARAMPSGLIALLDDVLDALDGGRCWLAFHRLRRSALYGRGMRDVQLLQDRLKRHLVANGLRLPPYKFDPHVSLAYGAAPNRTVSVEPLGWQAGEILLVESVHGEGRHVPHGCWPLRARQFELPLG